MKEKKTLHDLKNNRSIIIGLCDKGGCIRILNTRDYLTKIHAHLQHHITYKLLTHNPVKAVAHNGRTLTHYMRFQHIIDTNIIIRLHKIYNSNFTLRPIGSGLDGSTNRFSLYITHFIQPLANNLPSHTKDKKHFLNLYEYLPPLLTNALSVTADFMSL